MGKMVRIDDRIYAILKHEANQERRSVTGLVNHMLASSINLVAQTNAIQDNPAWGVPLTVQEIDAEILQVKYRQQEELEYVQDEKIAAEMNATWEKRIKDLENKKIGLLKQK